LFGCCLGKTVVQAVKVIYMLFVFGGSGHAYAFHLHSLRFTSLYWSCGHEEFFICRDGLFIEYHNAFYFFMMMPWG
jgi:hypothetical protein